MLLFASESEAATPLVQNGKADYLANICVVLELDRSLSDIY